MVFRGTDKMQYPVLPLRSWRRGGFLALMLGVGLPGAHAEGVAADEDDVFDSGFLVGQRASEIDMSRFGQADVIPTGTYSTDIYLNGHWQGRHQLVVRDLPGTRTTAVCLTPELLDRLGVEATTPANPDADAGQCRPLSHWLPEGSGRFDLGALKYELSIPQVNLKRTPAGYVPFDQWQRGINAASVSYNASVYRAEQRNASHQHSDSSYLGLNTRINLAGWQFRHSGTLDWHGQHAARWNNFSAYLRRGIPELGAEFQIGEHFTDSDMFESVHFRGASLRTDTRMLPDDRQGYAPVIRGVVQSNARIQIYQHDALIYQTSVASGAFAIDDLRPIGSSGDLFVDITEANGSHHRFTVAYASTSAMLRPGISHYNMMLGQAFSSDRATSIPLAQFAYRRGLTNRLTGYGGFNVSNGYEAFLVGGGWNTGYGALTFDVTRAHTQLSSAQQVQGFNYKLSYRNVLEPLGTGMTASIQRHSSPDYLSLSEVIGARARVAHSDDIQNDTRQYQVFSIGLDQPLGQRWGRLGINGSQRNYWGRDYPLRNYQISYSNSVGAASVTLSMARSINSGYEGGKDTRYSLAFSMPLGRPGARALYVNGNTAYSDSGLDSTIGVSGTALDEHRLGFAASLSQQSKASSVGSFNATYQHDAAIYSGSYSQSSTYRQFSAGVSGSMVAFDKGVVVSNQQGDTMAIVNVPDGEGARIKNGAHIRVNRHGYALLPHLSAYRRNSVSIDPQGVSANTELQSTRQDVVPYAGAVAYLTFNTHKGHPLFVRVTRPNGMPLPFGAQVVNAQGDNFGTVAQAGRVYLTNASSSEPLYIHWGDESCRLVFDVLDATHNDKELYPHVNGACL